MSDFERVERAIADQERELQSLESEIQEKRQLLGRQKDALALLQPLLSELNEPAKDLDFEPYAVPYKSIGLRFYGRKKGQDNQES
jgi:hypothetical protein